MGFRLIFDIFNEFSTTKMCNFDREFSFNSYSLNFSSNLTKTLIFKSQKPDLSNCERAISVDQVLSALEHSKDRLLLFDTSSILIILVGFITML